MALTNFRTLPLLGFGCALGQASVRFAAVSALLLGLGVCSGIFSEHWLISVTAVSPKLWLLVLLVTGPLSCLVAGISLALPDRFHRWFLPLAALLLGAILGIAIKLNDPGLDNPHFAAAAATAALWLVAAISLTWRRFERPWFRVAGRILGSWLIAFGLMLGGATLTPRHSVPMTPAQSPDPVQEPTEFYRRGKPFPTLAPPRTPFVPPEFDPSRQP